MNKGSEKRLKIYKRAKADADAGRHHEALFKLTPAFAAELDDRRNIMFGLLIIRCHESLHSIEEALGCCDFVESLLRKVHGAASSKMAELKGLKAIALLKSDRFEEAREVTLESMKISELLSGIDEDYLRGLGTLAEITLRERDFFGALKFIETAHTLMRLKHGSHVLADLFDVHASTYFEMGYYQESLSMREKNLDLQLRASGPNHPKYAISCIKAARLYATLKQIQKAVDFATKAVAINQKMLQESNPSLENSRTDLALYQKALIDPVVRKQVASELHRLCNYPECGNVEKKMGICTHCNAFYLCKRHVKDVGDHMSVCPNHPDALWVERKLDEIVKCRRCRKESKLMTCSLCGTVWYCGAQCQKEDWKRHKVFCRKK